MHNGVFIGANSNQSPKILILGESHHHTKSDDENYTTTSVINNYFKNPHDRDYKFFDKIAQCFNYNPDDRELFWNRVIFGNYVEKSDCGIGDTKAEDDIKSHRVDYNNNLFQFINENEIETVFCFGRRVYNNLPSFSEDEPKYEKTFEIGETGNKSDYIKEFIYFPNVAHKNCDIKLKKELKVYSFRHPSAQCGFDVDKYSKYLANEIKL